MGTELIANMLKKARADAGRSVKEVSDYLCSIGISIAVKTIYGWEAGRSQPDIDTFLALCRCYGIKPEMFSELGQLIISDCKETRVSDEAMEVAHAYDKAGFKNKNTARHALDLPLLVADNTSSGMTSSASDKQDPPISERVAQAEEEYIKSMSGGARKTASSASNTTDGKNEKAV